MSEKEGSVTGHTNTEEVKPEDDEIDPIVTQNYLMDKHNNRKQNRLSNFAIIFVQ